MHTSRNFAILRDFMEIAWYRDHRDKYSSLARVDHMRGAAYAGVRAGARLFDGAKKP